MTARRIDLGEAPVLLVSEEGPPLGSEADAVDLVGEALSCGAKIIALPVRRLHPDFLQLRTMAGFFVQKLVNYRLALAVVGDISEAVGRSKALADYVRESGKGGHLLFISDLAALESRLP